MNSFSQGIFVFKNGLHGKLNKRGKHKITLTQSKLEYGNNLQLCNKEFERIWEFIQLKVDEIQSKNNHGHLSELCSFVTENSCVTKNDENDISNMVSLRVAALLTGINKPDHHQYFTQATIRLLSNTNSRTIFLPARDCPNVRTAIETLVSCILNNGRKHKYRDEDDCVMNNSFCNGLDENDGSDIEDQGRIEYDDEPPVKLRRSQYTMDVLQSWYDTEFSNESNIKKPQIAIIMPNFEEFKPNVIKDLIVILSNHCKRLPFVLILGVATSTTALLNTLSFNETTRINLRVFSCQLSNQTLDQIFSDVILTPKCPFQLSSNVLDYLKSVFIFYDLTAKNFLKSFHYCLLDQYSNGNAYSLCATTFEQAKNNIVKLSDDDLEMIRRLPSFRPYVEAMTNPADILNIFKDDTFLKKRLIDLIRNMYTYLFKFYAYIRFLWTLVKDLPKSPMGKRLSDIYMFCHLSKKPVTTTEEFEKCWQLLGLMSKDEFIALLDKCYNSFENYEMYHCNENDATIDKKVLKSTQKAIDDTSQKLLELINKLKYDRPTIDQQSKEVQLPQTYQSRTQFLQEMKQQRGHVITETNNVINEILDFLRLDVIETHLLPRERAPPLFELFIYSDYDKIRTHLRGTSRSAIHKALIDPHSYLQCKCCAIDNSNQLLPTMPDNSIAYGLLLESGQQINIYDWMSAFNTIVGDHNAETEDDNGHIPPEIQAKFTRARAELHFMGFTKNSKRKTDHVTRTTW